jgi:hypothetical protein
LRADSSLQASVRDGLRALGGNDGALIDESLRADFADSLDLDAATRATKPHDNRWDYLIGHAPTDAVVGVEPHAAKTDQVSVVIEKRRQSIKHLQTHLREGKRVSAWLWVASGSVDFHPHDKQVLHLAQNGITFVGKRLLAKHLPHPAPKPALRGPSKPRRQR